MKKISQKTENVMQHNSFLTLHNLLHTISTYHTILIVISFPRSYAEETKKGNEEARKEVDEKAREQEEEEEINRSGTLPKTAPEGAVFVVSILAWESDIFPYVDSEYAAMLRSMKIRARTVSILLLVCIVVALIVFLAMQRSAEVNAPSGDPTLTMEHRTEVERIIRMRINSLSTEPATLGGRFQVEDIEWNNNGTARVTYSDGHSQLEALAVVQTGSGRVRIESFVVKE